MFLEKKYFLENNLEVVFQLCSFHSITQSSEHPFQQKENVVKSGACSVHHRIPSTTKKSICAASMKTKIQFTASARLLCYENESGLVLPFKNIRSHL